MSEGTSFIVTEGTTISASPKDSIQKKQKVKVYVKSEKTLQNISKSDQFDIVLNEIHDLDKSRLAKNKSAKTKKEVKKEKVQKDIQEELSDFPKIASFPVPRSCLSNSEGSVHAIVPASHQFKKTSTKIALVLEKVSIETDSKLNQNYFWIDKVSIENSEVYSIRPPPVFVII